MRDWGAAQARGWGVLRELRDGVLFVAAGAASDGLAQVPRGDALAASGLVDVASERAQAR